MEDIKLAMDLTLGELTKALDCIDLAQVDRLIDEICKAEKVFFVGVGRVLLALQAWVKRLNHIGIRAIYVGAIDEPAITAKDLLIVGSGSGESVFPAAIARLARGTGASVVQIGSNRSGTVAKYANLFVRIPCRTKLNLPDEIDSAQPMSSLFEQTLFMLGDIISGVIIKRRNINIHDLWRFHANLE